MVDESRPRPTEVGLRPPYEGEEPPRADSTYEDWGPLVDAEPVGPLGRMMVEADGVVVGSVSWHAVRYGPNAGSQAWNVGIALVEVARGLGIGSRAQRMLAEHLFATTSVDRVEASTDVENVAEQRALEKAGFRREGVLRGAQARADGRHDLVSYAVLRADLVAG